MSSIRCGSGGTVPEAPVVSLRQLPSLRSNVPISPSLKTVVASGTVIAGSPALTALRKNNDTNTGRVVGNILTPIPVTLDGRTHDLSVDMEDIAYTMGQNDALTLQIVGSATPFENFTAYGAINVSPIELSLPTADSAAVTLEKSLRSDRAPVGSGGMLGI